MKGCEVFENISEEACRELEAIVGAENITTDPNICGASYGFGFAHEIYYFQGTVQPPAAVVLPKTTEQVARIVKVCNRHGIVYHPVSSHTIVAADPAFLQNSVAIDLKRMNNWEIDERNMYAIAEAGVIAAQISAEANKRDMYYVMPGGGAPVSALVNHFSFGWGHFCWRATPHANRRLNGVEWVSPDGEIHRMGSLAVEDDAWYWGEGLGPDTIGLLHGISCWFGGMGIVTKVSFKLYPFQPERLEPQGMGPDSNVAFPPRVRYYNITFLTKEALVKVIDEIGKADIAHVVNIVPAFWRTMAKCRGERDLRNEFFEGWDPVTAEEVANTHILRVLLAGRTSLKQLEYEERVLMDIVNENGGTPRRTPQRDEGTFRYANTPDMWMMTGVFGLTEGGLESTRCTKAQNELFRDRLFALPHKLDYVDQKGELPWYLMWNRGRIRYTENHVQPDAQAIDPEAPEFNPGLTQRFMPWMVSEGVIINIKTGCRGIFDVLIHPITLEEPACHHYNVWLRRFKEEFDPEGVSGAVWPYALDKVVEATPQLVTQELQETIRAADAGPWLGNPE